jgi:hypothetical protein
VVLVACTWSGHVAWTVRVTVPITPPGTIVVADVVPLGGTSMAYPVTANDCAPMVAVAVSMCIVYVSVSLLAIDHVITWSPSEHTALPERTGWCANAGIAVTSTNNAITINDAAATTVCRRPAPLTFLRASALTLPPSKKLSSALHRNKPLDPA